LKRVESTLQRPPRMMIKAIPCSACMGNAA
jgi:hypothetical protein